MNGTSGTKRLIFLDFVRGIAALFVLFEHVGDRLWPQFRLFTHGSFSCGKFGVAAFFLTSGFVIPLSLERGGSLKRFWVSRFFRLYPLYWLSIALCLVLYLFGVRVFAAPFTAHVIRNSFVNLTMFQEFVGVPHAEGLYYTLTMEMVFYVFFSILYWRRLNHFSLRFAWLGVAVLAGAGLVGPGLFHLRVPLAGLFYGLCLLVGTALYRHFTGEATGKELALLLICLAVVTVPEIYCNYVFIKKGDLTERFTLWAVLLPWASAYLLFLGAYLLRTHSFPRFFAWLGAISYSVYLLHPTVASAVPIWSHRSFSFLATLILALSVATLTYRFVEQPFIAFGKRLNGREVASKQPAIARGSERVEDVSGVSFVPVANAYRSKAIAPQVAAD
jgi:peptidoglycan/LPS O-acetylase OafA/YrhL